MTPTASELGLTHGDDAPVVASGNGTFSRGELRAQADELAQLLSQRGAARVLVRSDDPAVLLRAIDASTQVGSDLWIAHTSLPDAEVERVIERHDVQVVLGDTAPVQRDAPEAPAASGRIYMMTSGTTGSPKIATHSLASLARRARAAADLPQNRGGRWLLTYQPTGFAGIQVVLTAVLSRGLVVAPSERTPAGFLEAARAHGVEQISGTPTFWRSFLMVVKPGQLKLRQITLGGEAADQATLERLRAAFPEARITHIYASTEAGVVFAVHDGLAGFPASWLGREIQGVELRIVDDLLQIRAPTLMQGYIGGTPQPLLAGGWLQTADRCVVEGGRVRVLGRQDSTINVGGSKVYPLAVETFLLAQPGVAEARVFGVANPIAGQLVAAEVVLQPGVDPAEARPRILTACRAGLAGYQVPRSFKVVDAIEVRASGKKGS